MPHQRSRTPLARPNGRALSGPIQPSRASSSTHVVHSWEIQVGEDVPPPELLSHAHFAVQAYEHEGDNATFYDVVVLEVIAKSEKEAITKAAGLAPGRAHYRIANVRECDHRPLKE